MGEELLQQGKILIIDDDEAYIEGLVCVLERHGCRRIKSLSDPTQALELYEEFQPDLILLDLHMARLEGLQLLEQLRAVIPSETYLPIIVVTADLSIEIRREVLAKGASDFLTKPCDGSEITLRVGNHLQTRFLHGELLQKQADLEERVRARTKELSEANAALQAEAAQRQQTEAALREREAGFRSIFEQSAAAGMVVANPEGRILQANPAFCGFLGYSNAELTGRSVRDITPAEDQEVTDSALKDMQSGTREVVNLEKRYLRADGAIVWGSVTAVCLFDSNRQPLRIVALIQDITERKRAREVLHHEREFLKAVLENLHEGVVACDAKGVLTLFNQMTREFHGLPKEPLPAEQWATHYDLYRADGKTRMTMPEVPLFRALQGENVREVEMVIAPRHGTQKRTLLASGRPMFGQDGQKLGAVLIMEDITERKEAENALRNAYAELETRVQQRTAELAGANAALSAEISERRRAEQEAERANRAKSEFISRMSHELRTPLHAIIGFCQLLEMEAKNPEEADNIEQILKAGRHLLELINEVLDISGIEAGRLTLSIEPVLVSEVVQEVSNLVRPAAARARVTLGEFACDRHILADQQRLKQVFLNLLSNAIKYNRPGGSVTLAAEATGGGALRLEVRDTGFGIAADDIQKLFTPFERVGAAHSKIEGIGLGLPISKRLIEAMGGSIGVKSVQGEGTTFWIELPLAEDPVAKIEDGRPLAAGQKAPSIKTCTILYIEDNLSNLKLIERILAREPAVKLLAAMQGTLGLDLAREHQPDVILLDLHLPGMNGDKVLEHLLADARTSAIPVIMISADATPGQMDRLKAAGASDYLTKPLDVNRFLAVLHKHLYGEHRCAG